MPLSKLITWEATAPVDESSIPLSSAGTRILEWPSVDRLRAFEYSQMFQNVVP